MAKARAAHHKKKFTLPLAIVAGLTPLALNLYDGYHVRGFGGVIDRLPGIVGVETDGSWAGWEVMKKRGVPAIIIGFLAHGLASKFGLNRMIAQAGIPFVRI